jgi:hypothetical protein
VRDALVFVRSTPRVTTGNRLETATDGWVTFELQPLSTFPAKRGAVQFFVKAYRRATRRSQASPDIGSSRSSHVHSSPLKNGVRP